MTAPEAAAPIAVVAAVIERDETFLITCRPEGTHLAGYWEFPGGKLAPGETPEACVERELYEEVEVVARARSRRASIEWEYPERRVTLHPIDCEWVRGDGSARQVSELRWALPEELGELEFPAANASLVRALSADQRR